MFSPSEIAYLTSQRLARLATVSPQSQPDVAPVTYQFDGRHFIVGGFDITRTFKYKHVKAGNARVALVVDDLATTTPWTPRGIKVHGMAVIVEGHGPAVLQITPERHWSWGIEAQAFQDGKPVSRKVRHA